jgi:hypothetical protein
MEKEITRITYKAPMFPIKKQNKINTQDSFRNKFFPNKKPSVASAISLVP